MNEVTPEIETNEETVTFLLLDDLTFNAIHTVRVHNPDLPAVLDNGHFIPAFDVCGCTMYLQSGSADPFKSRYQYAWVCITGINSKQAAAVVYAAQVRLWPPDHYHRLYGDIGQITDPSDLVPICRDLAKFLST